MPVIGEAVRASRLLACVALLAACGDDEPRTYADPAEPYRRTLEELIVFQQDYIREHGEPAKAPFRGFEPVEDYVTLATARSDAGGWAAVAFDRRDPMWSCVYKSEFVGGLIETLGGKVSRPAEVVCDDGAPRYSVGTPEERNQSALNRGLDWPERRELLTLVALQNSYRDRHGRFAQYAEIQRAGYRPGEGIIFHVMEASPSAVSLAIVGDAGQCMYWDGTARPLLAEATPEMTAKIVCTPKE